MRDAFHKSVYVGLGIIAGSAVLFGALCYFFANDIMQQSKEISENRAVVRRSVETAGVLAAVKENLTTIQRYQTIMDRLLPDQLKLLDLQRSLDVASRLQQVALGFTLGGSQTEPKDGRPGMIPFSIRISGPLENVLRFMKYIESESQEFLLSLDGFDLKRTDATTYEVVAAGKTFFK